MRTLPSRFIITPKQRSMMARRTQPQRPNCIMPKVDPVHPAIHSLDPAFLDYQRAVRRRGMEELPLSTPTQGLWDERAVATSFANASYISGWSMNPVTCPPVSNTAVRNELELATGFLDPRHRRLFRLLADMFFSPTRWREHTNVHFNRLSSTGAPLCTPNDVALKLWILRHSVANWRDQADLLLTGKIDQAADKYGASPLTIIGFRRQSSDAITVENGRFSAKERLVNDMEYALSGGNRGRRFPADRSVMWDGEYIPDMFAQRTRTVWGAPAWLTYPMTAFLAQCRHHYFAEAEYTLKHSTDTIRTKLRDSVGVRGLDISQYDQSIADWMIDEFCDVFKQYLGERSAALFEWQFHLPWWLPNPNVNGEGGVVVGNPTQITTSDGHFLLSPGLPSGIAPNPDMGKFLMLWTLLCITADELGDIYDPNAADGFGSEQSVEQRIWCWLKGRHPLVRVLNCGDDTVLSTTDSFETLDQISDAFNKPKGYYFKMEVEAAPKFLGNVICQTNRGIEVYPDIFSAYANWEMAERSVDSKSRIDHWAEGFVARNAFYQLAPEWETFARIRHDESKRVFGAPLDEWASIRLGSGAGISTTDSQILEHPERLFYLPVPEDLSPDILNSLTCGIDAEEAANVAQTLMKE